MKTDLQIDCTHGIFRAYIDDSPTPAGTMQFNLRKPNIMVITHTITTPGFEGKGVGKALVNAGVAYAQERAYQILPICSFARALIERNETWKQLLFMNN